MADQIFRTKEGLTIAYLSPRYVDRIMSEIEGHVTVKNFKSGRCSRVFVIEEECSVTSGDIRLVFWKDSYIELE